MCNKICVMRHTVVLHDVMLIYWYGLINDLVKVVF